MVNKFLIQSDPEESKEDQAKRLQHNPPKLSEALLTLEDCLGDFNFIHRWNEDEYDALEYAIKAVLAAARHEGIING